MGKSVAIVGLLFLAGVVGIGVFWWSQSNTSGRAERVIRPTVSKARRALEAGQFDAAYKMCQELLDEERSPEHLILAGECATKAGHFDESIALYDEVSGSAQQNVTARWAAGEVCFHVGDASGAIRRLQAAVAIDPKHIYANQRLASLLNSFGRRFEASKYLSVLLRANQMEVDDLLLFGNSEKAFAATEEIRRFLAAKPEDPLPSLGTVAALNLEHRGAEAIELAEQVLDKYPDLVEAHAQLGLALEMAQPQRLVDWSLGLPKEAEEHPTIWGIRARMLEDISSGAAIRCYCSALMLRSDYLQAHLELARLLKLSGREPLANRIASRANKVQRANIAMEQIYTAKRYPGPMEEAARMSLQLGRYWEAAAWSAYARSLDASLAWPLQLMTELQAVATFDAEAPVRSDPEFESLLSSIAQQSELKSWEQYAELLRGRADAATDVEIEVGAILLEDVASDSGLDFSFDNNSGGAVEGRKIFEITGGGVGVLDFDLDGWPDTYLAQAGTLGGQLESRPNDQLFRNVASQVGEFRFTEITDAARVLERNFSQGVACGDVDGDGFEDIYVCNVFSNSLLLNQGDGTFLDASALLPEDKTWTCSAAIADLDNDGLPEIYDANYVDGPDHLTRICRVDGIPRGCPPLVFNPAADRLLSPVDGRWKQSNIQIKDSNSLGVTVFRLHGDSQPSIFVAVDQQANLLLRGDGPLESFQDEALVSGLAYDEAGSAQACMGIATGDVNKDGRIDLMVTNFVLEHNTFYLQQDGYFEDGSLRSQTMQLTKPMLGFGCQFADLQRDGNLDVLLLNGHIDDHTHVDIPEEMPAQLFVGSGNAAFKPADPETSGELLREPRLGRALAVGDFNRDGLQDFVASYLESPASLFANRSKSQQAFVNLRLVGVRSSRTACGTEVRLSHDGEEIGMQQLTTGDGYQSSNERLLSFTIPADVDQITIEIDWIGGLKETREVELAGRNLVAVEGQGVYHVR